MENQILNENFNKFQPNRKRGLILSFFSLLLLGILPIISNSRPEQLNSLNYAFYLSFWELICSLPLLGFELKKDEKGIFSSSVEPKIKKKTLKVIGITGLIFSISTFFYVFSFEKAGTITASIAIQTYPLFSIVWESKFLHKKKHWGEIVFLLLMIFGIIYLGTSGTLQISGFSIWFLVTLIVPLLWSIAHVTIKNTLDKSPITPNQVTFFRVLISTVVLFVISILINGFHNVLYGFFIIQFQYYAFAMGFVYYIELVNWFYAVKNVDVSVASSITTPTPVITLILAVVVLNEKIFLFQFIAMGVIFVGLYGMLWIGKKVALNKISNL